MKTTTAKFSIPFNGDLELVETAAGSGRVAEVYFTSPGLEKFSNYYPRMNAVPAGAGTIKSLAALCRRKGIKLNLLLNKPLLLGDDLRSALKAAAAADAVTLSDPIAAPEFRRRLPKLDVQASMIMGLDTVEKVRRALELGIGTITLAPELNRDFAALKALAALKKAYPRFRVKLLANYNCVHSCVFMHAHYMLGLFHEAGTAASPHDKACFCPDRDGESLIKRPFIRPEDIALYAERGYADVFKLVTRNRPSGELALVYEAYFGGRCPGNLFQLVATGPYRTDASGRPHTLAYCDNTAFPGDFAVRVGTCAKICHNCGYCARVAAVTIGKERGKGGTRTNGGSRRLRPAAPGGKCA